MAKALVGALALASVPSVLSFRDTSPFFLFSTANLDINNKNAQVAQASKVTDQVINSLGCQSRSYLVVEQRGVSADDYLEGRSPEIQTWLSGGNSDFKSSMIIDDVVGTVNVDSIVDSLRTQCNAEVYNVHPEPRRMPDVIPGRQQRGPSVVFQMTFAAPDPRYRQWPLDSDSALWTNIRAFANSENYTIVYATTPRADEQIEAAKSEYMYEAEDPFGEAVHMELKRDTTLHKRAKPQKQGALFERYQFLSPGLFMAILAALPLLLILLVGIRALASLEVSYFAFSKEMGPAAQRKQMQ